MRQEIEIQHKILELTRNWISNIVIGLNLCPFAKPVFEQEKIRYTICLKERESEILELLTRELEILTSTPSEKIETSLVIIPNTLTDFLDFNDFSGEAEELVGNLGLRGVIQVVGFHPGYQFEGTEIDAAENYTNRSPYPMLHLLRESSITALAAKPEDLLEIPKRNVKLLNEMGVAKILELLKKNRVS